MENPILASNLNDFVFCPASIYFHRMYSEVESKVYQEEVQVAGTNAHKNIDNNIYSTSANVLTSIEGYSEKYNIICKADMYFKDKQLLVERKKRVHKIYDGQIFQIYGQYFCLNEMGYKIKKLQIYSMDDNKKYDINLPEDNPQMLEKFEKVIKNMTSFDILSFVPNNKNKCGHCIYEPICYKSLVRD